MNSLQFIFDPEFWILGLDILIIVLWLVGLIFLFDHAQREFNLP